MKITKADMVGTDLHLRCECMENEDPKKAEPDTVYGFGVGSGKATVDDHVKQFMLIHRLKHQEPEEIKLATHVLSKYVGRKIEG